MLKKDMRYLLCFLVLVLSISLVSCRSKKIKDKSYLPSSVINGDNEPKLNIFVPRNTKVAAPILIFVHGGYWNSGRKGTYDLLGRNFASRGIVTVIPDYTLSPAANYDEMTKQIAAVIKWVKVNAGQYNGNPKQIFITGHSAGGHLAALAVMNPKYGTDPTTIAGLILNDAAGLDMNNYLKEYPPTTDHDYLATWTNNPENWKDASPIYFIDKNTPPILMYVGEKTYPSIKDSNSAFLKALHPFQPEVSPIFLNKKHVPMATQYFWPWSDRFDEVINFMKLHSK
ncbi:alpha/beta hydrolase [Flavobacterium sp. 7A]|uniref:alpha/beta hydrolase n=1 Tax=Flavobacterium sp. 7A TaxID=2940571 RepID=UPI0029CAB845|nr:alpha/beta hydrolase [Flavobacterium sp. 7A]MCW2120004.1 acetyl esterase/lipase [Flavobacterium sp. 7A]